MDHLKKLLLSVCFFALGQQGLFAQNIMKDNEYFFTFSNGLRFFVIEDSLAKDVTTGIVFNCGAYIEDEEFNGLSFLFEKIMAERVQNKLNALEKDSSSRFSVYSETSYEYVALGVTAPLSKLKAVMQVIQQCAIAPIDTDEVRRAANISNAAYFEWQADPYQKMDSIIGTVLWSENLSKRIFISYWSDSAIATLPEQLTSMIEQYFCPANSLLVVQGKVNAKQLNIVARDVFENWKKCTINLFARFPGYNYKTVLANSQLVMEDIALPTPFYEIAYQGPPPYEGMKYNYCAMILSAIFANPDSKVSDFFRDSCRLVSVQLTNDMTHYISQLTFTVTPDSGFLGQGIECFRLFLWETLDTLINEQDLEVARQSIISSFNARVANHRQNLFLIANYWKRTNLDDYHTILDTVRSITTSDIQDFFKIYLRARFSVTGLAVRPEMRAASGIDSIFTPTATDVTAYRLNFLKNSGRFASSADDSIYNSLVQFLILNPEVNVKVNGICHETELPEIEDKELRKWVSSLDYFLMNPPSLAVKKKFRLDVYRSLMLMKKLIDSGISKERLFGSASRVRGTEEIEKYYAAAFFRMFN